MDQFEKFIRSNRAAFDDRNPDPAVWDAIESRLPRKEPARRLTLWQVTSIAAVGLVLVLSGIIVGLRMNSGGLEGSPAYVEFREAEMYYQSQLEKQVNQLAKYEYDDDINSDLAELQDVYDQLTTELEDGLQPNQNDIIQALIQNYQTRIDLLGRVLERLEEGASNTELSEDEEIKI